MTLLSELSFVALTLPTVSEEQPPFSISVPKLYRHCPSPLYVSARAALSAHYSWDTLDLMAHRLEGLIFSSVLIANRSRRVTVRHYSLALPKRVLDFMGNGLSCGEFIWPVSVVDALIRHWSLGDNQWRQTERT